LVVNAIAVSLEQRDLAGKVLVVPDVPLIAVVRSGKESRIVVGITG
jgi:predicted deacylase